MWTSFSLGLAYEQFAVKIWYSKYELFSVDAWEVQNMSLFSIWNIVSLGMGFWDALAQLWNQNSCLMDILL